MNHQRPAVHVLALWGGFTLAVTPLLAMASEGGSASNVDALKAAGALSALLGLGLAVIAGILLAMLFVLSIFIALASKFMGLRGTFGTAFKAAFLGWLLGIAFGAVVPFAAPMISPAAAAALPTLASGLALTFGIKMAYGTGFLKALITTVIAFILTVLAMLLLLFLLLALGGLSGTPALVW